ncbi:dynamin family protein [uncultured Ottowia sp.]|mgnify:FL=1|uniref:dynamin family protein n=1 Tax=uncultured Ottowia sp. TaxID=543067 RepID=UPI0025931314|nr:dynamin family protein [uncultured Ottowia sp.]
MVLAVVGTMKAGKSTTINAIVGREILPNRNRPMTALPTLIEHAPGQKTPVLYFEKRQPISELIKKLKEKNKKPNSKSQQEMLDGDSHLQDALQKLHQTRSIAEAYQGEEAIFDFLAWLNDLVRLAKKFDIPFPYQEYSSVNDLPRIKIEFFHLQGVGEPGSGTFTILDTPGFNEEGQADDLFPVMSNQISKATAVLAVMDYTQMGSEADGKLREQLRKSVTEAKGHLFVLVNRFDQKNTNSMNEQETKNYVSRNLLHGEVTEERVFPVSAYQAFLAKRAECTFSEKGCLSMNDSKNNEWIADFANQAFGAARRERVKDGQIVNPEGGFRNLWEDSKFDAPKKEVIQFVYQQAAFFTLQGTVRILLESAAWMEREISARLIMQDMGPNTLGKIIDRTTKCIGELDCKSKELQDEFYTHGQDNIKTIIDGFKKKHDETNAQIQNLCDELKRKQFPSREDAQDEWNGIIRPKIDEAIRELANYVANNVGSCTYSLRYSAQKYESSIEEIIQEFSDVASNIKLPQLAFEMPTFDKESIGGADWDVGEIIDNHVETREKRVAEEGVFAWFMRLVGWGGYKTETEEQKYYDFDAKEIKDLIDSTEINLEKKLHSIVLEPAMRNGNKLVEEVGKTFAQINHVLQASLHDKEKERDKLVQLRKELESMEKEFRLCDKQQIDVISQIMDKHLNNVQCKS